MSRNPAQYGGLTFVAFNSGSTGVVNIPAATGPLSTSLSAVTMSMWLDFSAPQATTRVFAKTTSGNDAFDLFIFNTNGSIGFGTRINNTLGSSGFFQTSSPISDGNWHHIVSIYDSSTALIYLYRDGVFIASGAPSGGVTGALMASTNNIFIGGQNATSFKFNGAVADIRVYGRALSAAEISALYNNQYVDPTALYGWWPFTEGSGTTVNDQSGNGYTGTLSGAPLPVWSTGKWFWGANSRSAVSAQPRSNTLSKNCSLNFNGSSSKVTGTTVSLANSDFTIAYRAKTVTPFSTQLVFSMGASGSTDAALQCGFVNGKPKLGFFGDDLNSSHAVGSDWHHYVMTFQVSTKTQSIYLDGVLLATRTATGAFIGTNTFAIGTGSWGALNWLSGNVSDLYLYSSLLSLEQIQALYVGNAPSGAAGIYLLNEGSQGTAYDSSGNGNNGTITSGTYTADVPSKARSLINGNLVYNGNFEFAPPTNVAQTTSNWLDGTSGGSSNNLFGWYGRKRAGTGVAAMFDSSNPHSGSYSMKVSTTATGSWFGVENNNDNGGQSYPYGIPCQSNTTYILTYWMKTQANSGSANTGAQVKLVEQGLTNLSTYGSATSTGITTTTGWTQYTLTYTTSGHSQSWLCIYLSVIGNDGTGTLIMDAWFDDIVLVPAVVPSRSLAV